MASSEVEINEIHQAYSEGRRDGLKAKTQEILKWAGERICFDNKNDGRCDHSACYELQNLVRELNQL